MAVFSNNKVRLHYYIYGKGPEAMLAFHGFGMKGTQFSVLESAFAERYTIYSFDLFFHGHTELLESSLEVIRRGLHSSEFGSYIAEFMQEMGFKKVSLLSYSMGALMALSIIEHLPDKVDNAYFIAPDGIRPNTLLQMGSRNLFINRMFYKLVYSPKTVNLILNSLLKYRYIDEPLYRILQGEFGTEASRLTCYQVITYFSTLRFNKTKLADIINKNRISTYFYFGKTDRLFPPSIGREFSAMLENSSLHILNTGHELVNEGLAEIITSHLQLVQYDPR
ncbi:alpha/beta fold hydrolase [Arcticibacter tournemirensis]|uniref:Alpha/beta hydrolase n=1 Tax=Arcticibacter tournemirensis TaxID=699437 RepID=A0A4Q0M9W4_9SPHI|nr:alpha/beta hydrolase [Arcticibacter tournemirensis]RXF70001.1 alpha/beta hydrolase [Arcticibacter tournemirensis]